MRRFHVASIIGCALLVPYTVVLCGGRSLLAERVAALEAVVNEQPVVVDANGTLLGPAIHAWDSVGGFVGSGKLNVVLEGDGLPPLPLWASRDYLVGTHDSLRFTSSDCSGEPYFEFYGTRGLLPFTMVLRDGSGETVFYSDAGADPLQLVIRSIMNPPVGCSAYSSTELVVPGFRPSLQPFTPPYSVVTRGELASP